MHSFRLLSGRHKSRDSSTTAFGVGFTCVYHLTDHPELITAGRHLVLDEGAAERKRIRVCRDPSCSRDHDAPGTSFILPWAREESTLRQLLDVETVDDARVARLDAAFRADASATLPFLKRITTIEIRSCSASFVAERAVQEDIVHIGAGELLEDWLLLEKEYDTSDQLKRLPQPALVRLPGAAGDQVQQAGYPLRHPQDHVRRKG